MRKLLIAALLLVSAKAFCQTDIPGITSLRYRLPNTFIVGSAQQFYSGAWHGYKTQDSLDLRYPLLSGSYTNPTWINTLALSKITGATQGSIIYAGASGLTQSNSNLFFDATNNRLGLNTAVPTYTLTLGSTSTGEASYNTVDQTTNFELVRKYWNSNTYFIASSNGGTGSVRDIAIAPNNVAVLTVSNTATNNSYVSVVRSTSGITPPMSVSGSFVASTAVNQNGFAIWPTVNQSTGVAAGYRGLWIAAFEQAVGSGNKYLIDGGTTTAAQGGGTYTSKFTVDNTGKINSSSLTASTAVVTDASKNLVSSSVTSTELNLLSGKTSLVTNVTSANSDISVATGATTPALTFNRSLALITPLNTYSTSATPSVALGSASVVGTGASISIVGNNQDGIITMIAGTGMSTDGVMFTVTLSGGFSYPTKCTPVLQAGSASTALLSALEYYTSTANAFTVSNVPSSTLSSPNTYIWYYHNGGY